MPHDGIRWIRANLLWLLLGGSAGAVAGVLIHFATYLHNVALSALVGAGIAIVGVAALRSLGTSMAVSEVVVNIPQLSRVTFATTKDRRALAYRIVNQMASRIAVQRLGEDTGYARKALNSLYALFTWLRNALDDEPGSKPPGKPNVDVLAMNMMNSHLRPFLERWHRRHTDWREAHPKAPESEWPDDRRFRAELQELQHTLHTIAIGFAEMAGYADWPEIIGLGPDTQPPPVVN